MEPPAFDRVPSFDALAQVVLWQMIPHRANQDGAKTRRSVIYVFGEVEEILRAIQQNEGISHRKLLKELKLVKQATLARHLLELCELSLIEGTRESLANDAQKRGLKPKFVTHYRITSTGVQYLRLMSEMIPDIRR